MDLVQNFGNKSDQLLDLESASQSKLEEEINTIKIEINKLIDRSTRDRTSNISQGTSFEGQSNGNNSNFISKFARYFTDRKLLGQGNIGYVMSAENRLDCCTYAIKRISVFSSDDVVEKVFDEIRAISQLDHPGIIRCHSTWVERPPDRMQSATEICEEFPIPPNQWNMNSRGRSAFIYVQMQLCKYSLENWLEKNKPQFFSNALTLFSELLRVKRWFKQIVSAIDYLHSKCLVHGNIKPSNILFTDMNTLKVSDMEITELESRQGADLYTSPDKPHVKFSSKSDIFSLGLILAEMCVQMSSDEKAKVFNNYREGVRNTVLECIPEVETLVNSLVLHYSNRPSCKEILEGVFFKNKETIGQDPKHFFTQYTFGKSVMESLRSSIVPHGSQDHTLSPRNTECEHGVSPFVGSQLSLDSYEPNFLRSLHESSARGAANSANSILMSPSTWDSLSLERSGGKEKKQTRKYKLKTNFDRDYQNRRAKEYEAVKRMREKKKCDEKNKMEKDESEKRTLRQLVQLLAGQLGNDQSQRIDGMMSNEQKAVFHEITADKFSNSDQDELTGFSSRFITDFTVNIILEQDSFGCVFGSTNKIDGMKYAVRRIPVSHHQYKEILQELREIAKLDHSGIIRYYGMWSERPPEGWQYSADMELQKRINPSFGSSWNSISGADISLSLQDINYPSNSLFIYVQMQIWNSSLATWLSENKECRDLNQMKSWFSQIASAVAYLHMKQLIHRDLMPRNIVLTENDLLKICNFSIAVKQRVVEGVEEEDDQDARCNPLYRSPEQSPFFNILTSKSDVFTLGLILTEMVVVVDDAERAKIFDNYRNGKRNDVAKDEETSEFLSWLTHVDPKMRPSCKEILEHPYLSNCSDLSE